MNNTDLSDAAFEEFYKPVRIEGYPTHPIVFWQECRRRAEARIKELEEEVERLEGQLEYAHYSAEEL